MKKLKEQILLETTEWEPLEGIRYGEIISVDEEQDRILVNHADNPLHRPLPAVLATSLIDASSLRESMSRISLVQLDFIEGDPTKPVIRDIFFSLVDQVKNSREVITEKTVLIEADRIILDGRTEVVIKSGEVTTVYQGKESRLTVEADHIRSTAKKKNLVQGGSILLN